MEKIEKKMLFIFAVYIKIEADSASVEILVPKVSNCNNLWSQG